MNVTMCRTLMRNEVTQWKCLLVCTSQGLLGQHKHFPLPVFQFTPVFTWKGCGFGVCSSQKKGKQNNYMTRVIDLNLNVSMNT